MSLKSRIANLEREQAKSTVFKWWWEWTEHLGTSAFRVWLTGVEIPREHDTRFRWDFVHDLQCRIQTMLFEQRTGYDNMTDAFRDGKYIRVPIEQLYVNDSLLERARHNGGGNYAFPVPSDEEINQTVELFLATCHKSYDGTPEQRAEIIAEAHDWRSEPITNEEIDAAIRTKGDSENGSTNEVCDRDKEDNS